MRKQYTYINSLLLRRIQKCFNAAHAIKVRSVRRANIDLETAYFVHRNGHSILATNPCSL